MDVLEPGSIRNEDLQEIAEELEKQDQPRTVRVAGDIPADIEAFQNSDIYWLDESALSPSNINVITDENSQVVSATIYPALMDNLIRLPGTRIALQEKQAVNIYNNLEQSKRKFVDFVRKRADSMPLENIDIDLFNKKAIEKYQEDLQIGKTAQSLDAAVITTDHDFPRFIEDSYDINSVNPVAAKKITDLMIENEVPDDYEYGFIEDMEGQVPNSTVQKINDYFKQNKPKEEKKSRAAAAKAMLPEIDLDYQMSVFENEQIDTLLSYATPIARHTDKTRINSRLYEGLESGLTQEKNGFLFDYTEILEMIDLGGRPKLNTEGKFNGFIGPLAIYKLMDEVMEERDSESDIVLGMAEYSKTVLRKHRGEEETSNFREVIDEAIFTVPDTGVNYKEYEFTGVTMASKAERNDLLLITGNQNHQRFSREGPFDYDPAPVDWALKDFRKY
jgi:hypothetical protein